MRPIKTLTVGDLLAILKDYDPAVPVVVTDLPALAEDQSDEFVVESIRGFIHPSASVHFGNGLAVDSLVLLSGLDEYETGTAGTFVDHFAEESAGS